MSLLLLSRAGGLEDLLARGWSRFELARRKGRERWVRSRRGLQVEAGAGVHHRCSSAVHGGDDLFGGDSLQVGVGRREV